MSRREKTLELIAIIGLDNAAKVVGIDNIVESYRKACAEKTLQTDTATALKQLDEQLRARTDELVLSFAEIYEKAYTEEEIDAQLAFHKSELGQKLIQVGPAVQNAIIKLGDMWANHIISELDEPLKKALGITVPTETAANITPAI